MLALILVFVLGMILAIGCDRKSSTTTTTVGQVIFPDSNLEASVREAINIPNRSIYRPDLASLTALTAHKRGISDLTGLEYCINLVLLDLGENNINDISALAGIPNLEFLILSGNNISDISALVTNDGLSPGDIVQLQNNPLSTTSLDIYIPQLREKGVILTPIGCN